MTEVPLVYPCNALSPRRYTFQDGSQRFRRVEVDQGTHSDDKGNNSRSIGHNDTSSAACHSLPLEDILRGLASVSSLRLRNKDVVLTTSGLIDSPEIVCVALSWIEGSLESPVMSQLDWTNLLANTSEAKHAKPWTSQIVKIQAFSKGEDLIRLVFVDAAGTFFTILLTDDLVPVDESVEVISTSDYIEEQPVLEEISGSELQSTMVSFVSPTIAFVAVAPFVVTVNLESRCGAVWSETQCLEEMRSRLTSISNLFHQASDLLLGKLDVGVKDMPSTAALCVTTSANPLFDPTFVFTLHSDASIRKWKVDPQVSLLPQEVTTITESDSKLPLPSTWSDTRNSVSLSARLYEQVFALAVHIKTNGTSHEGSYDDTAGNVDTQSDCRLWVIHGDLSFDSKPSCLGLTVPQEAVSLAGMCFRPTVSRCTLGVVFQSAEDEQRTGSIQVIYPPSNMSILSTKPMQAPTRGSLDVDASRERSRIRALLYGADIVEESFEKDSTLEQDLHELDTMYLKYLFRPVYPRGTGTILQPSTDCIRRAVSKLVPGTRRDSRMSIELETVRAIHEWRNKENRKLFAITTLRNKETADSEDAPETGIETFRPESSSFSVYESFIHADEEETISLDDTRESNDSDALDQERLSQVTAHENRWRRLLLQVWEEEQTLRLPLHITWLDNLSVQVIVRAGVTTVAKDTFSARNLDSQNRKSPWAVLDNNAMKLLQRIENDKEKSIQLFRVEQRVRSTMASAHLAVFPLDSSKTFIEDLTDLARWASTEEVDDSPSEGISDAEHAEMVDAVSGLSCNEIIAWVDQTSQEAISDFVGFDLASERKEYAPTGRITWNQNHVANCQLRHAVCSFSVRCIDAVRRLRLSRCLLLLELVQAPHAEEAALRGYIHSIAILWAAAQLVPMPSTTLQSNRKQNLRIGSPESYSPPIKRLSFGDETSSILAPQSLNMTTTLDVLTINISQTIEELSGVPSSPIAAVVLMGKRFFREVFYFENTTILPELGVLPTPSDHSVVTEYPRLALRLLAPFVAFTLAEESADLAAARKETLAECLLVESNAVLANGDLQLKMRQTACNLLVPAGSRDEAPDHERIRTAFKTLNSLKSAASPRIVSRDLDDSLARTLQRMIHGNNTDRVAVEVRRLCELGTVQSMFAPLATGLGADFDGVTRAAVHILARNMFDLSRLMRRLTILERHVRSPGQLQTDCPNSTSGMLLEFIVSAIKEMENLFPQDICHVMPEYINLWSRLFDQALAACHWEQAYKACVSNPDAERRDSNLKRLVRTMVDSGALQELLERCTVVSVRSSADDITSGSEYVDECVDLYEIASEILAEAISQDVYTVRAASPEPLGLSDYQGALYALHASQKQWRRAAQSMDLRFVNARRALNSGSEELALNPGVAVLRDGLVVEDLVLSAVSSMNALELVTDHAHQFIVSGELGPYHSIPVDGTGEAVYAESRLKRTRCYNRKDETSVEVSTDDRISRFMTLVELEGRALRSIALRALFFDSAAYAKSAFLREFHSSDKDIDELFKKGYYRHGLLLAKAMTDSYETLTGSSRPDGQDLFYDSLKYMLYTYLVPLATHMEPHDQGNGDLSRPSLRQLHAALDDVGSSEKNSPFVSTARSGQRSILQNTAVTAASQALLRRLTTLHSTVENPIAVDVATFFLDLDDDYPSLPAWLERLLIGPHEHSNDGEAKNVLSRRPNPGVDVFLGDPSALLTLYTRRGMFNEACNMIAFILSGMESHEPNMGSGAAASRLPEKGDIDFVPFKKIDILWNLMELAMRDKSLDKAEHKQMKESRRKMEIALEEHFSLMKISEKGLLSARTLRLQS